MDQSGAGSWSARLRQILFGVGLIAVSIFALAAPIVAGSWSLQFLCLIPLAVGLSEFYSNFTDPALRTQPAAYATGALAIAFALLLFLSPGLVIDGVIILLLAFLLLNGALKIGQAFLGANGATPRTVTVLNGAFSLLLAALTWLLWRKLGVNAAIGVAIAGYAAAEGWRQLVAPLPDAKMADPAQPSNIHPDPALRLGEHELFRQANSIRSSSTLALLQTETYWLLVIGAALFATHIGRMQVNDTWLGLISPIVATGGDIVMALVVGTLLVLPVRLLWRRLTRPLERKAWQLRISGKDAHMDALPRQCLALWTDARCSFSASLQNARGSLPMAGALMLRLGLPLALLFAAVNPVWGFSWYFNTESWASGFYQKMTELRVDVWRARMVDAVMSAYGGASDDMFRVSPPGIDSGDFSFIVIGDTGEGDASQLSLVDSYLNLGQRADIKFLVISSDVIYPAGAMSDYENNFYLPFKGFSKPIYAIPGNHDWFDALEGFNANFLEPRAAHAALAARAAADLNITSTDSKRIDKLLAWSRQLRDYYGIQIAGQRGPFFDIQTKDFALIAIDTGIRRTVDERQLAWIKAALQRASGKFTMAIVGHPKYAAGVDTSEGDDEFTALYGLLENAGVRVMMAGDTHAFEYYRAEPRIDGKQPIHHFVNGGGGAYLSIGGALAWPEAIPTRAWAFYPSPDAVRAKLDAETPLWKQPVWQWIKRFGAWPVEVETLSGMFDFNHAPFYQSYMEVRVERSRNRIVLALHGVTGPVRWRDVNAATGSTFGGPPDEPVEFIVEMAPPLK